MLIILLAFLFDGFGAEQSLQLYNKRTGNQASLPIAPDEPKKEKAKPAALIVPKPDLDGPKSKSPTAKSPTKSPAKSPSKDNLHAHAATYAPEPSAKSVPTPGTQPCI